MPGRRVVELLVAAVTACATGGCVADLCTRDIECERGYVCTARAECVPAPDASASVDGGSDADAGASSSAVTLDASPLDERGL